VIYWEYMNSGVFIVIDGIDGSGKATQIKLLYSALKNEGREVEKIDFPQYGTKSAGMVEEYLNGKYGQLDPYQASVFYTVDRFDASHKIKKWLKEGKIVLADRYVAANMGHQGGKIEDDSERIKYLEWLYGFEYNLFKIPKPDYNIILVTSVDLSMKMSNNIEDISKSVKRKAYLGDSNRHDLHERDRGHLENTLKSYLKLATDYPDEFQVINCVKNGQMISKEEVHNLIKQTLKGVL